MVREVNKISLYEAIRRKKEEGLAKSQQPQPVPQQNSRKEPRIQLKQPPIQVKPALQSKQAIKPTEKVAFSFRSLSQKREKQPFRFPELFRGMVNDNSWIIWSGVVIVTLCLIILIFNIGSKYGYAKAQYGSDDAAKKKTSPVVLPGNVKKPADIKKPEEPVKQQQVVKQSDIPQPIKQPTKEIEVPKPQLPQAIQNQLQKPVQPAEQKPTMTGDNAIAIVAYTKEKDLLPVQAFFKQNGIETELLKRGSYLLLITKDRFENPNREGTDGYKMKQKIKKLGAGYKAPEGCEPFGATPFQDAYPMKIK